MFLRAASKIGALTVWLLVGLCAVYWSLKLFVRPVPLPPQVTAVATTQALRGDLTRLLGAAAESDEEDEAPTPAAAAASRFRLVGVVAPRSPRAAAEGVALIAVDGRPAKAYRVGTLVDGDLVLQAVRARGADLGARGTKAPAVALDVAALPPPATGVPGGAPGVPGVPGMRPPGAAPVMPGVRPLGGAPMARPMTPSQRAQEELLGEDDDEPATPPPTPTPITSPPRQGAATQ